MTVKKFLCRIAFSLIDLLPGRLSNKLKMAATCCFGKGWGYLLLSQGAEEFKTLTVEEIRTLYHELSERSINVLCDYLKYSHLSVWGLKYFDREHDVIIIPKAQLFPYLDEKERVEEKFDLEFMGIKSSEALLYHHGLKFVSPHVLEYIKGTVFLDVGAYGGDSSFALATYLPERILAFEPSKINSELCRKNLQQAGLDNVEVIQLGVADKDGVMYIEDNGACSTLEFDAGVPVAVVALDEFFRQHQYGKIGLLKADVEGMGLKMLQGAVETVKKDRPVLLIAIYHNQDEFMGIYKYMKENVPDYDYKVEALAGLSEVTLIAWPREAVRA